MNPPRTACGRFADSFPCVVAVIAILNADILPFLLPEAFGCFFLAPRFLPMEAYFALVLVLCAAGCALLYRWLCRRGVARFEAL